jgi:hypothetical protein
VLEIPKLNNSSWVVRLGNIKGYTKEWHRLRILFKKIFEKTTSASNKIII